MELNEIEKLFVEKLSSRSVVGYELRRGKADELIFYLPSPCTEVGYVKAVIRRNEILLSCKITHTHFDSGYYRDLGFETPELERVEEAVTDLVGFLQGENCASIEVGYDGRIVSYGWGKITAVGDANEEYKQLIQQLHGGPSTYRAWSWSGEIDIKREVPDTK